MSGPSQERPKRRLQFTLRRMLLWTVVVALYCGLSVSAATWHSGWLGLLFISWFRRAAGCTAVIAVFLKTVTRSSIACHLEAFAGGVVTTASFYLTEPSINPVNTSILFLFGCGTGWLIFLVLEATCRLVDWADRFIGRMTKGAPDG